ncbi:MAG: hypothetical protein IBX72_08260 [Nitrospirae bacterium]|nr:hypothetical protein [Nitrospirota bacterium]
MDTVKNFISTLMATVSNCSLYSMDHIAVDELTRKSLMILDRLLAQSGSLEIMLIEDDLIINKVSFKGMGLQANNLKKRLKRKGLSRIQFLSGVTFTEFKQFISEIQQIGKAMPSFPHIKTGVLDIQLDESRIEDDFDDTDVSGFVLKQIENVKEVYRDISQSGQVNIIKINEVIGNFVSACKKQINILKLLTYAKSREEYSYIHATNVSVLSIFQMETLGIRERLLLRDIGIAGLFHDVGKLFISEDTLVKRELLEEKD